MGDGYKCKHGETAFLSRELGEIIEDLPSEPDCMFCQQEALQSKLTAAAAARDAAEARVRELEK